MLWYMKKNNKHRSSISHNFYLIFLFSHNRHSFLSGKLNFSNYHDWSILLTTSIKSNTVWQQNTEEQQKQHFKHTEREEKYSNNSYNKPCTSVQDLDPLMLYICGTYTNTSIHKHKHKCTHTQTHTHSHTEEHVFAVCVCRSGYNTVSDQGKKKEWTLYTCNWTS